MICTSCSREIPDDAVMCCYCGRRFVRKPRKGSPKRPNKTGSVYKRGTTWEAQVVVGYKEPKKPGGQPVPIKKRKSGFATRAAALIACADLMRGGGSKPAEAPRLLTYWETYKAGEYAHLSDSKQTAYRIAWDKLKTIQTARVDQLTVQDLREAVSSVAKTYYPARDCKTVLTALFTLAGADGFADKALPSYIVLPSLEEKERETFSDEEQKALWKLYESGDRRAAIPLIMIYTGMMPGEAMALKVEHIDLEQRLISGVGMKTKVRKKTPIVISEFLLPVMEDLIDHAQPSGYIWRHNEDLWREDYYAALDAAKIRRLTPYSCRHTTATALAITNGIAPQTVQKVMRWSTSKMLDRYAHPQLSDALSAVDILHQAENQVGNNVGNQEV